MTSAVEVQRAYVQAQLVDRDGARRGYQERERRADGAADAEAGLHDRRRADPRDGAASTPAARSTRSPPTARAATGARRRRSDRRRRARGPASSECSTSPSTSARAAGGSCSAGFGADGLLLEEVHRFHYPPATSGGPPPLDLRHHSRGDEAGHCAGARVAAERHGRARDASASTRGASTTASSTPAGQLLEDPVCYRDDRTDGADGGASSARSRRERGLRAHGHPVPAVQHALPALRRTRARGCPAAPGAC